MKIKNILLLALLICFEKNTDAQISILSAGINAYNVTPQSLVQINVMNNSQEVMVYVESKLFNSANEIILNVKTEPFILKKGMNAISGYSLHLSAIEFSNSNQANYVKSIHTLPSGKYNACYVLNLVSNEPGDEYCVDMEADISSFLSLVNPADKDTIDTHNPILVWTHSEPFNLLAPGEYFRIVVSELMNDQNAESGITSNIPLYMKNYVATHQLLYPYDAKELQQGKRYAWQVQKLANGIIVNKSEAWEFVCAPEKLEKDNKYATLKNKLDGGYYLATNNKVFFKFDEEYGAQTLNSIIYNEKREAIIPQLKNETQDGKVGIQTKSIGYNRYEIDLNELNISKGMYTLEVKNEKNESFLLKFYVQ